jgi:hypothetical protein
MMRKKIRYIPISFLWIAWLVLTVHLMIPHDHHLVDTFTNQENSCPVSHGSSNHHPLIPIHCHAFNDLASEKAITFVLNDNIQSDHLSFNSYSDSFLFDLQLSFITIHDIRKPFSDPSPFELSALRAPPVLS